MKISHSFAYEKREGGAVILRCFLRDGIVEVPESLDGLAVKSLSPYAFSAHADPAASDKKEFSADYSDALCGNDLRELILPQSVRSIGKYCFYNCEKLTAIEFPGSLCDLGSGAFAGCHRIREIRLKADPEKESILKELLEEIKEEVLVTFLDAENQGAAAKIFFPYFFENGVENTPARILVDEVHGSGKFYRNAFQEKKLDFAGYDALFPYALAQEEEGVLIRLVLCRLLYPVCLDKKAGKKYADFLREHLYQAGLFLMDLEDTKTFSWLLHNFESPDEREVLRKLSQKAAGNNQAQMQSILMSIMQEFPACTCPEKRWIL